MLSAVAAICFSLTSLIGFAGPPEFKGVDRNGQAIYLFVKQPEKEYLVVIGTPGADYVCAVNAGIVLEDTSL
jgi:hypothetical protein